MARPQSISIPSLVGSVIIDGRLVLRRVLGQGSWGVVYLAESTNLVNGGGSPLQFAVKVLRSSDLTAKQRKAVESEVGLHRQCSLASSGVLKVYDIKTDADYVYLVTEYCPDGDLFDAILGGRFEGQDSLVKSVIIQILDALEACHKMNIYHRDLKPENILLKGGGNTVVLADFGLATTEKNYTDVSLGSEPFMSPEMCGSFKRRKPENSAAHNDIWAVGVLIMNLACGCFPWAKATLTDPGFSTYLTRDSNYLFHTFPITSELNDLLKCVFTPNPDHRITIPLLRWRVMLIERFGRDGGRLSAIRSVQSMDITEALYGWPGAVIGDHARPLPSNLLAPELTKANVMGVSACDTPALSSEDMSSSGSGSEGPYTPEQLAADAGAGLMLVPLEDIPELDLSMAMDLTKSHNEDTLPPVREFFSPVTQASSPQSRSTALKILQRAAKAIGISGRST